MSGQRIEDGDFLYIVRNLRGYMKEPYRLILKLGIATGVVVYSAICWHSIKEIHYLKLFFPAKFTVEEAFYASAIELIKVVIIGIPFLLIIGIFLYLMRRKA
jgi:hypothetical protein